MALNTAIKLFTANTNPQTITGAFCKTKSYKSQDVFTRSPFTRNPTASFGDLCLVLEISLTRNFLTGKYFRVTGRPARAESSRLVQAANLSRLWWWNPSGRQRCRPWASLCGLGPRQMPMCPSHLSPKLLITSQATEIINIARAISNKEDGLHSFIVACATWVWGTTPINECKQSSVCEIRLFLALFQNNAVIIIKE